MSARRAPTPARQGLTRRPQPLPWALLTLVWVLLWGNFSWINVLSGVLVAALVLVAFPMPRMTTGLRVRPWATFVLLGRFLVDLVVACVEVAYKATAPWVHPRGAFIRVPLRSRDDLLNSVTAGMTTLVPGSVAIDIEDAGDDRVLLVQLFDVRDAADLERGRRSVRAQEERVLRAFARDHRPDPEREGRR